MEDDRPSASSLQALRLPMTLEFHGPWTATSCNGRNHDLQAYEVSAFPDQCAGSPGNVWEGCRDGMKGAQLESEKNDRFIPLHETIRLFV